MVLWLRISPMLTRMVKGPRLETEISGSLKVGTTGTWKS